jgi:hypothetical protein
MHTQIERALDNLGTSNKPRQEKMKSILKRYSDGEIGLDEAYYELLDDELIPMPQRCAVSAKIPLTEQDETRLKEKIRGILAQTGG